MPISAPMPGRKRGFARLGLLMGLASVGAGTSACEQAKAVGARIEHVTLASVATVAPLAGQAALCHGTHGTWLGPLQSCVCPPHRLFSVQRGCGPVLLSASLEKQSGRLRGLRPDALQAVLASVYDSDALQVGIDLAGLDAAEVTELVRTLDDDPTAVLSALTLPPPRALSRTVLRLARVTPSNVETLWGPDRELDYPPRLNIISLDPMAYEAPHANTFAVACSAALRDVPEGAALCTAANLALADLARTILPQPWITNFTEEGPGCRPDCAFVGTVSRGGVAATYNVLFQDYAPLSRLLRLGAGASGTELLVALGPTGHVEAAVLKRHVLADATTSALLFSERTVFDPWARPIGHEQIPRGEPDVLGAALSDGHSLNGALPTDTLTRPNLTTALVAVLVDSAIDPRMTGLRPRLNFAPGSTLDTLARDGSGFSYANGTVSGMLGLLDDDFLEGRHGSRIASVVAANLPGVRLSFIRALDIETQGPTPELRDKWIDLIRSSHASLVNLSVTYSRLIADCDGFFGPIFTSLPDVLFVVGAGNNGAREPTGTCPVGLAQYYPNVLTVAGVDRSGRAIHAHSNYGFQTAKVAAPYEGQAVEVGGSLAPPPNRLGPISGTSYSAAVVSNAALRLLARHPTLRLSQWVDTLMNTCKPTDLEVGCGGALDVEALERR